MFGILTIVLPTFLVIFIGYLFGKTSKTTTITPVVDIAFYIGGPALTFVAMMEKEVVLLDAGKIWAACLIISFGCGLVAWVVFQLLKQKHSALYVAIAIMNSVNIPFPVIYLAYGSEGLLAATLFSIPNIILICSLGIYITMGKHWKDGLRELARVPVLYAAVIGLLLNLNHIVVPELIMKSLNLIAMMAIPLVLIVLGFNLSKVRLTALPTTLLASFLRIFVGFAFGLLSVNLLHIEGVYRSVVLFDSAMPAAANAAVIATKYNSEAELVSSVVFVTTLISLVSIPFLLTVFG